MSLPDFWHGPLPDPTYVFLYRQTIEVALSVPGAGSVTMDPVTAIRAWSVYNSEILDSLSQPQRPLPRC